MRLIFTLIIALVINLIPIQQSSARATGTIYGKVHYDGKGISNILIEVMIGNCFDSAIFKALSTNDAGFYRVDGVMAGTPVNVAVNDFTKTVRNKLYKATCGKAITLLGEQLNRHDIALKASETTERPAQQPSTTSTPTAAIYGKVHSKGQGISHISVEAMIGNCLSPAFKTLSTNASGFYRFDDVTLGKPVHIAVNGFSKTARNQLYKATCSKGIKLRAGQLYRHNVALENSQVFKQCIAGGGSWYNSFGFKGCSQNYSDGGKVCTDGKQCKSRACLAVKSDSNSTEGACAASSASVTNSCAGIIRNGRRFPKPCP